MFCITSKTAPNKASQGGIPYGHGVFDVHSGPAAGKQQPGQAPASKFCIYRKRVSIKLVQPSKTRLALLLLALLLVACTPRPASPGSPIAIDTPTRLPVMRPTNMATLTFSPTPPLNPAMLTPSTESARLGDILMKISADLPCQEYGWSSIVVVDATEARFECSYTEGENKNTIYISFRLSANRSGFECFHGYIASSDESSYPVTEGGENGKTSNSYTRKERFFTWTAQGVNFTIIEFIDGNQNSIPASPGIREKIYEKVTQLGLITGDGEDCTQ